MRLALLSLALLFAGCRTVRPMWSVTEVRTDTQRMTTLGPVVGGDGTHGTHAWLGIPFAAPPVGPLRWRAPQPASPWTTPRAATRFAPVCPQADNELAVGYPADDADVAGSEDCLYLNVWAPAASVTRLPVMVWIHGGGNSIGGAGFYDLGHLAADQQVVIVSVQYRLGPFGWFRHPALREGADEDDASGNYGTLDVIAALRWVQANAAAFGGTPENVTVFGESAGGQNVYAMLLSPKAKGLFHRAIAQSPVLATSSLEYAENFTDAPTPGHGNSSQEVTARLMVRDGSAADLAAAKAKLASMSAAEVARYLRAQSIDQLITAYQAGPKRPLHMLDMPLVFGDGAVLPTASWQESFAAGAWNRVPVMTGTNRDEAKLFFFFDPRFTWKLFGVLPRIRDEQRYQAASETFSRLWRAWAVDAPATAMVQSGATDVFSYRFDWDKERSIAGTDLSKMMGAGHGLEMPFVLGHFDGALSRIYGEETLEERQALSKAMMAYWGEFARTGKPGRGGTTTLPEWPAYDPSTKTSPRYLALDGAPQGLAVQSRVETTDAVIDDTMKDARIPDVKDRCEGLKALATLNFLAPDRFAAISGCQGP